mmetsp:Transcript_59122/g.175749  ORF Transcript_59122/g.175749 Transcript_59122/m.175749 type:complete len:261 (+) Transcript_59122:698-1480(+)
MSSSDGATRKYDPRGALVDSVTAKSKGTVDILASLHGFDPTSSFSSSFVGGGPPSSLLVLRNSSLASALAPSELAVASLSIRAASPYSVKKYAVSLASSPNTMKGTPRRSTRVKVGMARRRRATSEGDTRPGARATGGAPPASEATAAEAARGSIERADPPAAAAAAPIIIDRRKALRAASPSILMRPSTASSREGSSPRCAGRAQAPPGKGRCLRSATGKDEADPAMATIAAATERMKEAISLRGIASRTAARLLGVQC